MIDDKTLLELALNSTRDGDWIQRELQDPPFQDKLSWANMLPSDIRPIWKDLPMSVRIIAYWVADRFRYR